MKFAKKMHDLFTDHPYDAGETYWEHLYSALKISARMFFSGAVQAAHALFPFLKVPRGADVSSMEEFCHHNTPEERLSRKNRITIK